MAFIDELQFHISAGDGGNGVVRWQHEYGRRFGGPAGGNGGRGGDVYLVGSRDIHLLSRYAHTKEFAAERGEDGGSDSMYGKNGDDLLLELPVGSVVTNMATGEKTQVIKEGEKVLLLKGGYGGYGNENFKSSTNTTPKESTPGKTAESGDFLIELELVADAGIIGLPNAGKSSLLDAITRAKPKIADYAFTTLEPNLGELYGFVLADIPGLIEGASEGKGLGHKFLRHIKRTGMLVHCVALNQENLMGVYEVVRKELQAFDPELSNKEELILLTKADTVAPEEIIAAQKLFAKKMKETLVVSVYDDVSLKNFTDTLMKMLRAKK